MALIVAVAVIGLAALGHLVYEGERVLRARKRDVDEHAAWLRGWLQVRD